jgi:type IV pilus assembly protein PilA
LKAAPAKSVRWARDANGSWACETTADAKYVPSGCTNVTTYTPL